MPELHLSRDDLAVWRDSGAGDRDRIVTHLATCAACREVAAEVERIRPAGAPPARFDPKDFVARGYRARRAQSPTARRWMLFVPLAAAAALVLAVMLRTAGLNRDTGVILRGGADQIELVRPAGGTVAPPDLTFEWKAPSGSDRFRLTVFDLANPDAPVIARVITEPRYVPTAEERALFRQGREYHWFVEQMGGGAPAEPSPAGRFLVR